MQACSHTHMQTLTWFKILAQFEYNLPVNTKEKRLNFKHVPRNNQEKFQFLLLLTRKKIKSMKKVFLLEFFFQFHVISYQMTMFINECIRAFNGLRSTIHCFTALVMPTWYKCSTLSTLYFVHAQCKFDKKLNVDISSGLEMNRQFQLIAYK